MTNHINIDTILDQIQDRGVYELEGIDPETVATAKAQLYELITKEIEPVVTIEDKDDRMKAWKNSLKSLGMNEVTK